MESLESLLREEFNATPAYRSVPVGELIATTRRLRRRRTASSVAAALSVLLIAVLGVLLVRSESGQPDVADTAPEVVDPNAMDQLGRVVYRAGAPWSGRFLDANRGFLLVATCPDMMAVDTCTARLLVTGDGGASYTTRPLPIGDDPLHWGNLWVFDDGALVFDAVPRQTGGATREPDSLGPRPGDVHRRWVSPDGGLTWREVSTTPVGPVDIIPEGAKLVPAAHPNPATEFGATVVTSDGTTYTLANLPRAAIVVPLLLGHGSAEHDGSYFVVGEDDRPWVSTDRGRSWQPSRAGDGNEVWVIGGAPGRVYGLDLNELSAPAPRAPSVWISEDRGRNFTPLPLPPLARSSTATPGDEGYLRYLTWAVLPAGGLLLADGAKLWWLPPGGDTFEPYGDARAVFGLGVVDAAIVVRGDSAAYRLELTTDGIRWQPTDLGRR